jgi:hypothetical protein
MYINYAKTLEFIHLTLSAPKSFVFVNICTVHTAVFYYIETDL